MTGASRPAAEALRPPPPPGPAARLRAALFASPRDAAITLALLALLAWLGPRVLDWAVLQAVWGPAPREQCDAVRGQGACWAVVWEKFRFMMFGVYPHELQWRPAAATGLMGALLALSAWPRLWHPARLLPAWALGMAAVFWLMGGGAGLAPVRTELWGGLPVTLILALLGVGLAFPLGVLLALGRRSRLPLVRALSVVYIEVVRGVPLITVLFVASVMFALFVPEGLRIDQLARAQVAIVLFVAAYLAEAVRGGLQAVPRGQVEAAQALGLPAWQITRRVVLPQALRLSIPPVVNSFISLFKDTSLVMVIAIYDFSYAVKKAIDTDHAWKPYFVEAFLFSLLVYWVFCFALSRVSLRLERDLDRARHP